MLVIYLILSGLGAALTALRFGLGASYAYPSIALIIGELLIASGLVGILLCLLVRTTSQRQRALWVLTGVGVFFLVGWWSLSVFSSIGGSWTGWLAFSGWVLLFTVAEGSIFDAVAHKTRLDRLRREKEKLAKAELVKEKLAKAELVKEKPAKGKEYDQGTNGKKNREYVEEAEST